MYLKGLLFDFDGTLYGDQKLWVTTIQDTLRDFQIPISTSAVLEKARSMIDEGTFINISGVAVAIARQKGVDKEQDVRTRFLSKLDREMDATGPGDELLTVLNTLRSARIGLGIVSFMRKPRLLKRLELWTLNNYFESIVTPEDFSEFKPSPLPFLAAIRQLHLEPAKCFVVGDEPVDMAGGKRAGARTVGVPRGFFTEKELKDAGAEVTILSFSDLPKIVVDPDD